jgi:hypothetical protein
LSGRTWSADGAHAGACLCKTLLGDARLFLSVSLNALPVNAFWSLGCSRHRVCGMVRSLSCANILVCLQAGWSAVTEDGRHWRGLVGQPGALAVDAGLRCGPSLVPAGRHKGWWRPHGEGVEESGALPHGWAFSSSVNASRSVGTARLALPLPNLFRGARLSPALETTVRVPQRPLWRRRASTASAQPSPRRDISSGRHSPLRKLVGTAKARDYQPHTYARSSCGQTPAYLDA